MTIATGMPASTTRPDGLDRGFAWIVAAAAGAPAPLFGPVAPALLIWALLPVWGPALWRDRAGRWLALLMPAAILNGVVVAQLVSITHQNLTRMAVEQGLLMLSMLAGIGGVLWASRTIGAPQAAFGFGLGVLANAAVHPLNADNPWKFSLALPVIILVLAMAWWRASTSAEVLGLLAVAAVSVLNDSRSAASILMVSLALLLWQVVRRSMRVRSTLVRAAMTLAVVVFLAYNLMQTFILQGFLGEGARTRSEAQLASAGFLLLGGRPEIGATIALLTANPGGLGLGTLPTFQDVYTAKRGMMTLNYDPNNGYVENYMFGSRIEVHSVLGDLWLRFGIVGMVVAVTWLVIVILGALALVATNRASALVLYLAIQTVWETFFSPMYTPAAQIITLAVALLVPTSSAHRARQRAGPQSAAAEVPATEREGLPA